MRERINRLARGIIDSEAPQVVITPEQVEEQVPASAKTRGELMVTSSNNLYIKGLVYSSNPRVTISNNAFGGLRNRIVFEINSQYLKRRKRDSLFFACSKRSFRQRPGALKNCGRLRQTGKERFGSGSSAF